MTEGGMLLSRLKVYDDGIVSMKWKIAALTLVTWPAAFWYLAQSSNDRSPTLAIWLASLPLVVAICIEAYSHWKLVKERPESYVEGSPIGNRIAVVLGLILLGLLLACTLLLVACGRAPEMVEPRSPVTVTPTGYEFLGSKFDDFDKLKDAVDGNPQLKLSLMINEERGCLSSERISQVVGLLKSRDESSVAFIGRSSTDVCQR